MQRKRQYVYADLLLDSTTGVLIHSLKLLSSDSGLRLLISTLTSLSIQLNNCWLILTSTDEKCYHFSGNIPANIAKLQASLLIHRKLHTGYSVKVLYAFSYDDVGKLVKDLIELRLSEAPLEWNESREWLKEDFTQQELFLISFPCINSYSAQLMLRGKCLKDLLIMSLEELQANFPTLPVRSLEMFYKICNLESSVYCDFSNEEQNVPQTLSPSPHSSPHPPLNLFGTDIDTTDWNKSELEMIHANTSKRHRSLPPPSSSSSIAPLSTNTTIIPTDQSKDPYHHSFIDLTVNTGLPTNADLPISLRQVDGALINETAQLPINNSLPMNLTADGSNVLDQSAIKDTSLSSDIKALQSTHHNEDKESGINSHLSFPPISHSSSRSLLQRRPFKSLDLGFDTSNGSHTPLVTNDRPMVLGGGIPVDKRIERRDKRLPVLLERGVKRGPSTHTGLMLDTAAPVDHRLSLERRGLSLEKEFLVNKRTQSSGGQSLSSETLIPSHIRYGVATRSSLSNNDSHQEHNLHSSTLNSVPTFGHSFDNTSFTHYSSSLFPPSFKVRRKDT
ncbi:PREDICTED: uncharacterized protein LOC109583321 [Amphimedon queenslandica]|uniref:Uncharacterized protein n=1 Tax=Amphimedon queenslandica TaxID=400682 RepID=A0AAN0JBU6_AMPQE|nr:PREDICTED: uncharacterized protein LOC109583321 [Amphimedon queenslandica]|eukprot:XP_019854173.1 PREDICTED: uncharacterized protein LOC109583321 [Amphimedon queenslandica]